MAWYLYIIKRKDGCLYTGITTNVARRFKEHWQEKVLPNKDYCNIDLLYKESFPDQFQAAKREKQIKGWTRKKKLALIKRDLALLKKL